MTLLNAADQEKERYLQQTINTLTVKPDTATANIPGRESAKSSTPVKRGRRGPYKARTTTARTRVTKEEKGRKRAAEKFPTTRIKQEHTGSESEKNEENLSSTYEKSGLGKKEVKTEELSQLEGRRLRKRSAQSNDRSDEAVDFGEVESEHEEWSEVREEAKPRRRGKARPRDTPPNTVCSVCNEKLASERNLRLHMRIHTGIKTVVW